MPKRNHDVVTASMPVIGAQVLRDQRHRRAVAAMAGDDDDFPHAGARDALAERLPLRERRLRRQRLRSRKIDVLGRNADPARSEETSRARRRARARAPARDRRRRSSRRFRAADAGRAARSPPAAAPRSIAQPQRHRRLSSRSSVQSRGGKGGHRARCFFWPACRVVRVPSHHGPERTTESNHEACPFAASVNGGPAGGLSGGRAGRGPGKGQRKRQAADAGQGLVRNQLGRRSRAWRLLPGGRRRHLQEIRPRRHHRAGRPERQQPHAADRRQDRFLHGREHADVVRRGRQQRAGGVGRRDLPEGSAGVPDASGIEDHQARGAEAADAVRLQGGHDQLLSMAEVRIRFQRQERPALYLQRAALHRHRAERDAGLCHLGAVRGRESRRLQARRHPARRLRLQHLFDPDRDARDLVEKKPDLVQRFVDASIIGWYNYSTATIPPAMP